MKFKVAILLAATVCFSFSVTGANFASEHTKKVCAKKLNDKSLRKGYHAFALSADREHCGGTWDHDSKRHAEFRAMKFCKNRKGVNCKIVRSGCNPSRKSTCDM